MGAYFLQVGIEEPVYKNIFSNNPQLKTNSNKEHDNATIHPQSIESIEELVERIIHSIPAQRLSKRE